MFISRVAWLILDCARRTSTCPHSCAFREQKDDLLSASCFGSSISLFGGRPVWSPTARNFLTRPPIGTPRRAITPDEGLLFPPLHDTPFAQGSRRTVLHCARPIPHFISRVAWSILDCARRTSTFLSCAFREQEDDQATLASPLYSNNFLNPALIWSSPSRKSVSKTSALACTATRLALS